MKNELHIAAIVDKPQLLNQMVSRLVSKKAVAEAGPQVLPTWKAANVSVAETFVSGSLMLDRKKEHFKIPFTTSFFFTCLQQKKGGYKIEWCCSLS